MVKAQSAIEYLMTYGWMLLLVAVAGAAIFGIVQNQSVESISGFTGANIQVTDFGITSDEELELVLRNAEGRSITVNSVNVSNDQSFVDWSGDQRINVGDESVVALENVTESGGSESFDVSINYDIGDLSGLTVSGTITGPLNIEAEKTEGDGVSSASAPNAPASLQFIE